MAQMIRIVLTASVGLALSGSLLAAAPTVTAEDFVTKLESIKPYIIPKEKRTLAQGEYLQTPQQRDMYEQFSSCINCMLCYAACPQYGLNSSFIGPAATALVQRYNLDTRDGGSAQRLPLLQAEEGVFNCTAVGYCSEVCPKHVDPALAHPDAHDRGTERRRGDAGVHPQPHRPAPAGGPRDRVHRVHRVPPAGGGDGHPRSGLIVRAGGEAVDPPPRAGPGAGA